MYIKSEIGQKYELLNELNQQQINFFQLYQWRFLKVNLQNGIHSKKYF
jgi:hypothetical protein